VCHLGKTPKYAIDWCHAVLIQFWTYLSRRGVWTHCYLLINLSAMIIICSNSNNNKTWAMSILWASILHLLVKFSHWAWIKNNISLTHINLVGQYLKLFLSIVYFPSQEVWRLFRIFFQQFQLIHCYQTFWNILQVSILVYFHHYL